MVPGEIKQKIKLCYIVVEPFSSISDKNTLTLDKNTVTILHGNVHKIDNLNKIYVHLKDD